MHLPLVRIGQHLVGLGNLLESLLGDRIRVHVGMQLARQPPVRHLDLVGIRVPANAERSVVVSCHARPLRLRQDLTGIPRRRTLAPNGFGGLLPDEAVRAFLPASPCHAAAEVTAN
jgi:hypothetical protein